MFDAHVCAKTDAQISDHVAPSVRVKPDLYLAPSMSLFPLDEHLWASTWSLICTHDSGLGLAMATLLR